MGLSKAGGAYFHVGVVSSVLRSLKSISHTTKGESYYQVFGAANLLWNFTKWNANTIFVPYFTGKLNADVGSGPLNISK